MLELKWWLMILLSTGALSGCCKSCNTADGAGTPAPEVQAQVQTEAKAEALVPLVQDVQVASVDGVESELGSIIRLATYNIQNLTDGVDDGWSRTKTILKRQVGNAAKIISEINADMITIQEIENMKILKRLNGELSTPYPHLYITQFDSKSRNNKLNIALMSRLPLVEVAELDFEVVQEAPVHLSRGSIRFMLELEEGRHLLGYGVHLKSNRGEHEVNVEKRRISAEIIRADADAVVAVNSNITYEVVVLGDTNIDPDLPKWKDDSTFQPFSDWVDLWRGVPIEVRTTLARRLGDPDMAFDPVAFDRVIVSPALKESPWIIQQPVVKQAGVDINNIYVHPGQNDIHVSDHYPVFADIVK